MRDGPILYGNHLKKSLALPLRNARTFWHIVRPSRDASQITTAIGTKRTIQPRPRFVRYWSNSGHWSALPPLGPVVGHEAKLARFQSPRCSTELTCPG